MGKCDVILQWNSTFELMKFSLVVKLYRTRTGLPLTLGNDNDEVELKYQV